MEVNLLSYACNAGIDIVIWSGVASAACATLRGGFAYEAFAEVQKHAYCMFLSLLTVDRFKSDRLR